MCFQALVDTGGGAVEEVGSDTAAGSDKTDREVLSETRSGDLEMRWRDSGIQPARLQRLPLNTLNWVIAQRITDIIYIK